MKNIFKYGAAIALMVAGLASCEELPDYQTTIDSAQDYIYVNPQGGDTFSTLVVHRPGGSTGSYTAEFQVKYNSTEHQDATVTVAYDPELVAEYNSKNGTSYAVLPKEYFTLENETVVVPAEAVVSADTVRIHLNESANLAALTERAYLAPFAVKTDAANVSESLGNVWFVVNTETNVLTQISSADAVPGMPAGGIALWSADCANDANLFDGNTSTVVPFTAAGNELIIDMKKVNKVTGLKLNTYNLSNVSIEYSEDGEDWNQAGTAGAGEYVFTGGSSSVGNWCVAVTDYISARYLKLSFKMANSRYLNMNGVEVYITEGTNPSVYAVTGADNVVTGKVTHKAGATSASDFSASFQAHVTKASAQGYTVTAAADNSLVAAYNQKYGTSYLALPAENISVTTASVSIPANGTVSEANIAFSLTGDLSGLTDSKGYLAAVKLTASGAGSSENRGAVYAVITPEYNVIKDINAAADVIGFQAGRTGWTATANNASTTALFDNSTSTRMNCNQTGNVLVVNMGSVLNVSGFSINGYPVSNISVEYGTDGSTWTSAGKATSDEILFTGRNSNSSGDTYLGFVEPLEASYLRVTFDSPNSSSSRRRIYEFNVIEVDSTDPTVYTICGTDNVFTGKVTHHVTAGSFGSISGSFSAMVTHVSDAGYDVVAMVDNSLVDSYNATHGTSYSAVDPAMVDLTGFITNIPAGATQASSQVSVALKGDVSSLTDKNGYLIPVKLVSGSAVTSAKRGAAYFVVNVAESDAKFMEGFAVADVKGTLVADRSAWVLLECDEGGVYDPATTGYDNLFDGDTRTYVRTWGGPVSFTVDLGKEYDLTGLSLTARTDNNTYATYQPTSIQIMASLTGDEYTNLGTVAKADGTLVSSNPTSYVALYETESVKVRYLKIEASYGSNMGTAEFNIYAK